MRGDLREGEFTYADRTDDVETKVELLRRALRERDYAVALSLADSVEATVTNERALGQDPGRPVLPASGWRPVEELPAPWARWASGWALYQGLALTEPIGQARQAEPVDLVVGLPVDRVTWPARELRVARLDAAVHVLMTMPRRGRPKYNFLANPMRARVEKLAGVRSVVVDLTWEPAWTPNRLPAARPWGWTADAHMATPSSEAAPTGTTDVAGCVGAASERRLGNGRAAVGARWRAALCGSRGP